MDRMRPNNFFRINQCKWPLFTGLGAVNWPIKSTKSLTCQANCVLLYFTQTRAEKNTHQLTPRPSEERQGRNSSCSSRRRVRFDWQILRSTSRCRDDPSAGCCTSWRRAGDPTPGGAWSRLRVQWRKHVLPASRAMAKRRMHWAGLRQRWWAKGKRFLFSILAHDVRTSRAFLADETEPGCGLRRHSPSSKLWRAARGLRRALPVGATAGRATTFLATRWMTRLGNTLLTGYFFGAGRSVVSQGSDELCAGNVQVFPEGREEKSFGD